MLREAYIEALMANEALADQVWEAWDAGEIDDQVASLACWFIVQRPLYPGDLNRCKADIELELVKRSANDPKRTLS